MRIASWNMQGNGVQKFRNGGSNFLRNNPEVILIQEAGVPNSTGFERGVEYLNCNNKSYVCALSIVDPTAINQRCTTCILVQSGIGKLTPYVGTIDVNRQILVIKIGQYTIATMHAIAAANESIEQVKRCIKKNLLDQNINNWIFMGDFNSNPTDWVAPENRNVLQPDHLNDVNLGYRNYPNIKMMYSANPTQGAGGIRTHYCDFVLCSNDFSNDDFKDGVQNETVTNIDHEILSDHNIIGIECKLF